MSFKIANRRFCEAWVTKRWLSVWLPLREPVARDLPPFARVWGGGDAIHLQVTRGGQMKKVERQVRQAIARTKRRTRES